MSAFAFITGGVLVVVGCFVPWRVVDSCFTTIVGCSVAPRSANWTIWQVGGTFGNNAQGIANFWNPSNFTWWGAVMLACGVTLLAVGVARLLSMKIRGLGSMWTVVLASSASIVAAVATVLVPAPKASAAYIRVFGSGIWSSRGPGAWVCLVGALFGLIGVLLAMHSERKAETDHSQLIAIE